MFGTRCVESVEAIWEEEKLLSCRSCGGWQLGNLREGGCGLVGDVGKKEVVLLQFVGALIFGLFEDVSRILSISIVGDVARMAKEATCNEKSQLI